MHHDITTERRPFCRKEVATTMMDSSRFACPVSGGMEDEGSEDLFIVMEAPVLRCLATEPITLYRKDYRRYRLGFAKGARGEVGDVTRKGPDDGLATQQQGCRLEERIAGEPSAKTESSTSKGCNAPAADPLTSRTKDCSVRSDRSSRDGLSADDNADKSKTNGVSTKKGSAAEEAAAALPEAIWLDEEGNKAQAAAFRTINRWRLQYRQFRRGFAQGAAGDISALAKPLTKEHLQLLPVSQLRAIKQRGQLPTGRKTTVPARTDSLRASLHLHFGGGKLGLGLVVGAVVKSGVPFVVVQRSSEAWEPLARRTSEVSSPSRLSPPSSSHPLSTPSSPPSRTACCSSRSLVSLSVNDDVICSLRPYTAEDLWSVHSEGKEGKSAFEVLREEKASLLLMESTGEGKEGVQSEQLLQHLLSSATSISTSLGTSGLLELGKTLDRLLPSRVDGRQRPTVYCCENDHKAVAEVASTLQGKAVVLCCMVDRICTDRCVIEGQIVVKAEDYAGQVVVLPALHSGKSGAGEARDDEENASSVAPLPFCGDNVFFPRIEAEGNYLAQRKLLLVNGLHTTLAFMTLCSKADSSTPGDFPLLTEATATEAERRMLWSWAVARILLLLWEHDVEVVKVAHRLSSDEEAVDELLSYARKSLNRISTIPDTTGRVLAGGIVNRYHTRLLNIKDFIDAQGLNLHPLSASVVRKSGLGLCELMFSVQSLISETKRFVQSPGGVD